MRWGVVLLAGAVSAGAQTGGVRFLTFEEVREVVSQFPNAPAAPAWEQWVRSTDAAVRARVQRGAEDSVSNLLLYGTSFTKLPRVMAAGDDPVPRMKLLAAALAGAPANERLRTAQQVLRAKGKSAAEIEKILAANLARYSKEQDFLEARMRYLGGVSQDERLASQSTLYAERGLSADTSLPPNWGIEDTLLAMRRRGVEVERIRDIAVIGPGLDFADKRDGFDFYPVQTIQPFALLETAMRLGHREARVTAFDLNQGVLAHVARLGKAGAYHIELPRDPAMEWDAGIVGYWEQFGGLIGSPAKAATPPAVLAGLAVRGVAVRAEVAARVSGRDLDVVAQTCDDRQFDLIVATNILVYYDRLQQSVALANIARMLRPGGVFLSNTVLPAQRPEGLKFLGRRSVSYSKAKGYGDDFVAYRKEQR